MDHRAEVAVGRWLLLGIFAVVLLVGCGGGTVPFGSAKTTYGKLLFVVKWPPQPAAIPAEAARIRVTVTAADLIGAITGEIVRPDTQLTLYVPAGAARVIDVAALDASGVQIAGGHTVATIVAGQINTIHVSITSESTIQIDIGGTDPDPGGIGVDVNGTENGPGNVGIDVNGVDEDPGSIGVDVNGTDNEPGGVNVNVDGPDAPPGNIAIVID